MSETSNTKPTQAEIDSLTKALKASLQASKRTLDTDTYAALADSINDLAFYNIISHRQRVNLINRLRDKYGADEESFAARESYDDATRGTFDAEGRVRS